MKKYVEPTVEINVLQADVNLLQTPSVSGKTPTTEQEESVVTVAARKLYV